MTSPSTNEPPLLLVQSPYSVIVAVKPSPPVNTVATVRACSAKRRGHAKRKGLERVHQRFFLSLSSRMWKRSKSRFRMHSSRHPTAALLEYRVTARWLSVPRQHIFHSLQIQGSMSAAWHSQFASHYLRSQCVVHIGHGQCTVVSMDPSCRHATSKSLARFRYSKPFVSRPSAGPLRGLLTQFLALRSSVPPGGDGVPPGAECCTKQVSQKSCLPQRTIGAVAGTKHTPMPRERDREIDTANPFAAAHHMVATKPGRYVFFVQNSQFG